jgi:hypothetical protein
VTGPQWTPNSVVANLVRLANDLDTTVAQLEQADRDATTRRMEFDFAFSKRFLAAEGSVDGRKHQATVATMHEREAAELAEAVVRHLRRRIDAIKTNIDTGRSLGAALRAEIGLAGAGYQP